MNLLLMGDLHIRSTVPENRIDDFVQAQFKKFAWILEMAEEHNATIIQPGDWFDTPRTSYLTWQVYAELLRDSFPHIYTIFGQHDMRFHTNPKNSPLAALDTMRLVQILSDIPTLDSGIGLYGASYKEEIPEPREKNSILVIHKLIAPELMWSGQKDCTIAKELLEEHDFKLIVSGDNHSAFQEETDGKLLFNCGSLMRTAIDQYDHVPCVVLIDTESWDYDVYEVPIEPSSKVFADVKPVKERDDRIQAFVQGLEDIETIELDFERNLRAYIKANKVPSPVVTILDECLGQSYDPQ